MARPAEDFLARIGLTVSIESYRKRKVKSDDMWEEYVVKRNRSNLVGMVIVA